ncbi:MAG: hypothetical protein IKO99_13480 [Bacteroidales bacterium]|nr:hypothetical protein [Bacteroidales bacterium]
MKKIFKNLVGKLLILTVLLSMSVSAFAQQNDKGVARVQKNNGIYAFCDNEPISEYDILDRVKSNMSWTGQFNEIRNKLIKKAVKDYPNCDGVVISMAQGGTDRAIIIKFKDGQDKDNLALARANKVNGLYIFTDCEPVNEYDIIDRESNFMAWSSQYQAIRDKLVKKAVKDQPNASGVILNFSTGGVDRASVIKFK